MDDKYTSFSPVVKLIPTARNCHLLPVQMDHSWREKQGTKLILVAQCVSGDQIKPSLLLSSTAHRLGTQWPL